MGNYERSTVSGIKVLDIHSPKHKTQRVAERDFYSLSYRYTGKIKIESDGQSHTSGEGSITFIPKGQAYSTEVCEDTHMVVVHFKLSHEITTNGVCIIEDNNTLIKPYFDRLAASYTTVEPYDFGAMALFYQLLFELSGIAEAKHTIPSVAVLAKKEIDQRFSDPSLAILTLSSTLGVSDSYLRRVFREAYGTSPLAYLTLVRIRCAKNMLESEFFSVEQIGTLCGFQSSGYFIQCFRKETGETPGSYRKRKCGIIT